MDRILFLIKRALKNFALLGLNYYIALGLFSVCILVAAIRLIVVNTTGKRGRGSIGLFVFYEIAFFINAVLCISESVFSGKHFESGADAYAFCLSQFAVCMFFWFALFFDERKLCASEKKIKSAGEEERGIIRCGAAPVRNEKSPIIDPCAGLSEEKANFDADAGDEIETENERFLREEENEKPTSTKLLDKVFSAGKMPDVNVGYVNNLIIALKAKNLQPDENDKLDELRIILRRLPTDREDRTRMNELLRFLLKKIAEYGVPA